jgi:hypothetical protein
MLLEDAIDEKYSDEIIALNNKRKKQIKDIENAKKEVLLLSEKLLNTIKKVLNDFDITISTKTNNLSITKLKPTNNRKKSTYQDIEFKALLNIIDYTKLLELKDLNSIDAIVYKITSIGVFIKINNIEGDLAISKSTIQKECNITDIRDVFNNNNKVTIQIIDKKKCIVKKSIVM